MKRTSREPALLTMTSAGRAVHAAGLARLQHPSTRPRHAINGDHDDVS
jgi:hypothetical protein